MFEDAAAIISLLGGVILFFYVMAKLNKNGAMEAVGGHGAIVVFAVTMTIALAPMIAYEKYKKAEERARYEELMKYIKDKK